MLSKKVKIVGSSWGITFETFADAMVSDPNSHLDLMQNESPVKPYKVEGRSSCTLALIEIRTHNISGDRH
jgi:hypothetical protein